ncbi:hypothetical protein ACHAXS_011594 [Conticribra weissflogii]
MSSFNSNGNNGATATAANSSVFIDSFENSNKQQQRRMQRQLAMQRMEEAAKLEAAASAAGGTISLDASANNSNVNLSTANSNNDSDLIGGTMKRGNLSSVMGGSTGDGLGFDSSAGSSSLFAGDPVDGSDNKANATHTAATTSTATENADSGTSRLTASAQNFMKECLQSPPLQPHEQILRHQAASKKDSSYNVSSTTNNTAARSMNQSAKQFLWDIPDDRSTMSGATWASRATGVNNRHNVNLYDIKNSFPSQQQSQQQQKVGGILGLLNALPLFGGGQQQRQQQQYFSSGASLASGRSGRSSKYRDEEGERLLNLASERLNPNSPPGVKNRFGGGGSIGNGLVENIGALSNEDKEYGNIQERDNEDAQDDDNDENEHDEERHLQRKVCLDKNGNLHYQDDGNDNVNFLGNFPKRRMNNQYYNKVMRGRIFATHADLDGKSKRPCKMTCAIVVGLAIVVGVGFGIVNMTHKTVPVVHGTSKHSDDDDGLANASPGFDDDDGISNIDATRLESIKNHLLSLDISPPNSFEDTHSAQYAALIWLTRDDPRQLEPESQYLGQRYGLAVLWFSTTETEYEWHVPEEYVNKVGVPENQDGGSGRRQLNEPSTWTNHDGWLSELGICGWEGVKCYPHDDFGLDHDGNMDGDVSRLEMSKNNMKGLLPMEVYTSLPYLSYLDFSDNGFAGTIAPEIGRLVDLEHFNLTSNSIGGSLPPDIGDMPKLKVFHMSKNLLGQSIPKTIEKLTKLRDLDLSFNMIKGTVPYELGKCTQLSSLRLGWNQLFGNLPHEFEQLKALITIDLSHNTLGGPIPVEIGGITYLQSLRLSNNRFSNTIPTEFGNLIHLDDLLLNDNKFTGPLPLELGNLVGLNHLDLSNNQLDSYFPPQWTAMVSLQTLDISHNLIKGEIPRSIVEMNNLRELNLSGEYQFLLSLSYMRSDSRVHVLFFELELGGHLRK